MGFSGSKQGRNPGGAIIRDCGVLWPIPGGCKRDFVMKCKNAINPPDHTKPIGKSSPAILAELSAGDQLLFVSGQVSSDAAGNVLCAGDARQQAEIVFSKIEQI